MSNESGTTPVAGVDAYGARYQGTGGVETAVFDALRNSTLHTNVLLQYFQGYDDAGTPVTFWGYTLLNGASDTYTWDSPVVVGDGTRIVKVVTNYYNCVMSGLSTTLWNSVAAGLYDGDDFGSTALTGAAMTYASCIGNAVAAYLH